MKPPPDNRTAAQAYEENAVAIQAAIQKLRAGLQRHREEQLKDKRNSGYTGDLGHVRELIERAARFVCGEEE